MHTHTHKTHKHVYSIFYLKPFPDVIFVFHINMDEYPQVQASSEVLVNIKLNMEISAHTLAVKKGVKIKSTMTMETCREENNTFL